MTACLIEVQVVRCDSDTGIKLWNLIRSERPEQLEQRLCQVECAVITIEKISASFPIKMHLLVMEC